MPNLSVRNLDDDLVVRLKRRAARHGHSTEAEVREILRRTLNAETELSFDELAAELRALTAGRSHTPAEQLIREGRDER
ncbi:MAG TPA: plasmid stabilization protein [Stellaceae bacterium]|jgi:plasmid stability protein|nr:plasmid stabilization protein [Stellaceae bacterium]